MNIGRLSVIFIGLSLCLARPVGAGPDDVSSGLVDLNICYSPETIIQLGTDVRDAEAAMRVLTTAAVREMNLPIGNVTHIIRDPNEVVDKLSSGEIDGLGITALEYLDLKDRVPLEPIAVTSNFGAEYEEYLLLINRNEGVKGLGDLKGKHLMIQRRLERSIATIFINTLLMKHGFPESKEFFGAINSQVKPSLKCPDIGDIGRPDFVGITGLKVTIYNIGGHRKRMMAVCSNFVPSRGLGLEVQLTH